MDADVLATLRARSSAVVIFILLNRINSAPHIKGWYSSNGFALQT